MKNLFKTLFVLAALASPLLFVAVILAAQAVGS